ncbi:MAG: universal stress protein [Euryarchaeota archaeon]|nr:universal stress protein [Euryarchaeota archaeon]
MEKILVATDGSKPSNHAVELACKEAKAHGAKLKALYTIGSDEMYMGYKGARKGKPKFDVPPERLKEGKEALEEVRRIAARVGIDAEAEIFCADPENYYLDAKRLIVVYAEEKDFDMIVLGSHGRTGISRVLLGSVSEYVARNAHCPVLIVK